MALALDASTPVAVTKTWTSTGGTNTLTTASFTPPVGAVLVLIFCANSADSNHVLSNFQATDSLGTHLTYTQVFKFGNTSSDTTLVVWTSSAVPASTAMTVSASYSDLATNSPNPTLLRVLVITGANTTSPIGVTGGGRGQTTNINASYVSSVAGSWGWLGYADWLAAAVPTVPTGESIDARYRVNTDDTYAVIQQTSTTPSAGTSVTMSTSTPTSGVQVSWGYFEIVPASGGGSTNHFLSLLGCGA